SWAGPPTPPPTAAVADLKVSGHTGQSLLCSFRQLLLASWCEPCLHALPPCRARVPEGSVARHTRSCRTTAEAHDSLANRAYNLQRERAHASSISVTGPSFTSSTAMRAPNTPRLARARAQKRSYSGAACSAGAAATKLGRLPWRVSP